MARSALLIGSPSAGLTGPPADVERVAELLAPRGFQIRRCVGQDATRVGILSEYRRLIEQAASGDAVAIYYSGHGAHSLDPSYTPPDDQAPPKRYHQFIVPMDLDESSDADFRGILSIELSSLLAQLTAKTRNVTVIFDCCHAGGMTRDLRLRLKALPREWFAGTATHLERLRRGEVPGFPLDSIAMEGNPDAVRIMAALPSQQAWEYDGAQGAYGLFTDALARAFLEAGDRPVPWSTLGRRVRELVQQLEPGQYPDVEGPSGRLTFTLDEATLTGVVPVESSGGDLRLLGGRLLGIDEGDEFVLMPPGYAAIDQPHAVGVATVTQVGATTSLITLAPAVAAPAVVPGTQAFPLRKAEHRRPVVIEGDAAIRPALAAAIAQSGLLRLPADDESETSPDVLAIVTLQDGGVHIREKADLDLISPLPATPAGADDVARNLERLARARKLEMLRSGSGACQLRAPYTLDWGRVVAGQPMPLPASGALVFVGDYIYARVRNTSPATLYVSIFDVGLAGRIKLLTSYAPSGVELLPGDPPLQLGYMEPLGWKGLGPLSWPAEVPRDGRPRAESLVVIITDRPQDLRALESPGMAAPKGAEAERSALQRLADQLATGRTRDLDTAAPAPEVRYAVEHIRLLVDPTASSIQVSSGAAAPAPAAARGAAAAGANPAMRAVPAATVAIPAAAVPDAGVFLIDERPAPSAAYRRPRGLVAPPAAVSVQLGEVVVHANRALFSTDVRVDALIITGASEAEAAYRAGTAKFPRIKDGDRLPLDKLLLYHGPARGFLDLAVWVSRADEGSLTLADMLKNELNGKQFKDAALVLAGLAVAAPTAGAIVAGLGAATTVANIAYRLISSAVGKSIGLYRTSLLANENFGVGRHPASGALRAQDFSFWYEVREA